jgi:spore photoproduct lyase
MALRRLALPRESGGGGYPVGLVIAPIMLMDDWQMHYTQLLDQISEVLDMNCDLTFELISHRFTPGSKEVLQTWYPQSKLDMDEAKRSVKRNKFGGTKYVYHADTMKIAKRFFEGEIQRRFPSAKILYWT